MDAIIKKSFTGNGKYYTEIRMKATPKGQIHWQIPGPAGNRDYGWAGDFTATSNLIQAVQDPETTVGSLASGGQPYSVGQATVIGYSQPSVHIQLRCNSAYNRDYGFTGDIENEALWNAVKTILNDYIPAEDEDNEDEDESCGDENEDGEEWVSFTEIEEELDVKPVVKAKSILDVLKGKQAQAAPAPKTLSASVPDNGQDVVLELGQGVTLNLNKWAAKRISEITIRFR